MSMLAEAVARLNRADGRTLICLPLYPPVELAHSFGLRPVIPWGLGGLLPSLERASEHLQSYACSVAQGAAQFMLAGPGRRLGRLLAYNACDTLRNLADILHQARRLDGRPLELLRWHLPQTPLDQTDADDYFRGEVAALIAQLERASGVTFSAEAFERGVERYRRDRELLAQASAAVAAGRLSFDLLADAAMAGHFMPVEEHIAALEGLLAQAGPAVEASSGRVLLSGVLPPPPELRQALERAGLRVAADDIAAMGRSWGPSPAPGLSPADYYLELRRNRPPCPTLLHTADQRFGRLLALCRQSRADGFVFVGEKFCEYEYFDWPLLQEALRGQGVQCLALELAAGDGGQNATQINRIEAFAEVLAAAGEMS